MPRILFVSPNRPIAPRSGGEQRTALLWRALENIGDVDLVLVDRTGVASAEDIEEIRANVRLVALVRPRTPPLPGWARALRRHWRAFRYVRAPLLGFLAREYLPSRQRAAELCELASGYDLVVGRYLRPTAWSGALGQDKAPVLVDLDDWDIDVQESYLRAHKGWTLGRLQARLTVEQLSRITPPLLARCRGLFVSNEVDRERLPRSVVLPNIPYFSDGFPSISPPSQEPVLLFVGSFKYEVNVRAVRRFVKWIWPRIRAYVPEARLRLVGVGLSEGMRAEFCRFGGVEAIGYVSDLSEEYANARAVVVPITEGGGTKIKVAEAAAFGRAALISAHSWRGYERVLPHGRAAHVAQDDEELVRGGVLLLSNYAYAYSLGLEARSVAEREFGFAAFARIVTNTVEICLRGGQA